MVCSNVLILIWQGHSTADQVLTRSNGSATNLQASTPSPDLLGDLLSPLAIEGPPAPASVESERNPVSGTPTAADALALAPIGGQTNTIQVCTFMVVIFL